MKTLAIRGTSEENMVARRAVLMKTQEKVPKLIEETGMRHYIAVSLFLLSLWLKCHIKPPESQIFELRPGVDITSVGCRHPSHRSRSRNCPTAHWLYHVEDSNSSQDATVAETSPRGRVSWGPGRFSVKEEKAYTICDAMNLSCTATVYLVFYSSSSL